MAVKVCGISKAKGDPGKIIFCLTVQDFQAKTKMILYLGGTIHAARKTKSLFLLAHGVTVQLNRQKHRSTIHNLSSGTRVINHKNEPK